MDKSDIQYSALLEEYKCLKSEIAANLASSRQVTNLTLLAFGVVASASSVLATSGGDWALLLGPPVFVALTLSQLRYTYLAVEMGTYINGTIARQIQLLAESDAVMGWESRRSELFLKAGWLPIRSATLVLPLLGAMLCVALYFGIHVGSSDSVSLWSLDRFSVVGLIAFAFVVGAAVYCFLAGRTLERARNSRIPRIHGGDVQLETPPDNQPMQPTGSASG